jgi:uncharacterized OB-fold protein
VDGEVLGANLAPHATYLDGLRDGVLRYQRCEGCAAAVFPPRVLCNHCGSTALTFAVCGGTGTVYSCTAVTQRGEPSYSVCLVDVDEGFRMMSTVVGIAAEAVAIGLRVAVRIEVVDDVEASGQAYRAVFTPVDR